MRIASFLSAIMAIVPAIISAAPMPLNANLLHRNPGDGNFLYPGGLGDPLNAGFAVKPSSPLAQPINRWTVSIPNMCKEQATVINNGKARCAPENIDVFEVSFEDSPRRSWVICRCKDSPATEADLIAEIGRIPPGMRQFVRNFMSFNVGSGAFTTGRDITFLGPINPTIVLHETSHCVDGGRRHSSTEYRNAIKNDSCWADYYAKSSEAESWAQINVLVRYKLDVGALPTASFGPGLTESCLQSQLWTVYFQTWAEIARGYDSANDPPRDASVMRLS